MTDLERYGLDDRPELTTIHFDSDEDWLELRRKGIGGSDIGAIMHLNKYSSPLKIYKQKVEGFKEDLSDNVFVKKGKTLENLILTNYVRPDMEKVGYTVGKPNFIIVNKLYPFLRANVDGIAFSYTKTVEPAVVEIKWVSEWAEVNWNGPTYGGVPAQYYAQVQLYMLVTGCSKAYIYALFDSSWDVHKYEILKDDEFCEKLVKEAYAFYSYNMCMNIPPKPDIVLDKEDITEAIAKAEGSDTPKVSDIEMTDLIVQYNQTAQQIKELTKTKEDLSNKIYGLYLDGHYPEDCPLKFSISVVNSSRFDTDKFKNDNPELYKQYLKQSTGTRLNIRK